VDKLPIDKIIVAGRIRKDMGDIDALAESMRTLGQLQPVVIGNGGKLIAGARRIKAAKKLGWTTIGYIIAEKLRDAAKALKAERDENTCRKAFTKSELAVMAAELFKLEGPAAAEREKSGKSADGSAGGRGKKKPCDESCQGLGGKARDKVAEALDVSPQTADRLKAIAEAAAAFPDQFGDLPKLMDEKSVNAAFQELKSRQSAEGSEQLFDAAGQPVPEHARAAFEASERIRQWGCKLDELVKEAKEIANGPGGRLIQWESALIVFKNIRSVVVPHRPTHVCPYCNGGTDQSCRHCKGTAWVPEYTFGFWKDQREAKAVKRG
jgi:ParB family chromosome partitioning protein